ncbi:MAG: proprotein convertase P-domain-containing protein, partial [Xanthomonadales bacterium]|nr:proprotein convertase P-domain-containing protein [Xanthomonadales bacterium]
MSQVPTRHQGRVCLARFLRTLLVFSGALISLSVQSQVIYTYENSNALAIPDNGCPTFVERTFVVAETFQVGGNGTIAVGIDLTHTYRGDLNIQLVAPNNNVAVLATSNGNEGNDHYRVMFSSNADGGNPLNDGDVDPLAAGGNSPYRRLVGVAALDSFYTGPANGTWRLRVCDNFNVDTGTLNMARLVLRNNAATAPAVCASNSTFDWGNNGNGAAFTSAVMAPDGITLSQVTTSGEPPNDIHTSYVTQTGTLGGHAGHYFFRMDTSGDTELSAEYVLFQFSAPVSGLAFDLLDVDRLSSGAVYEDMARVFATGPGGRVPYQMTLVDPSNLAYAGDFAEADNSVNDAATNGNVRYSFLEPVSTVAIQYAQGDQPNTDSGNQWIGISDLQFCGYDHGDAPASYGTLRANNGPRHGLRDRTRLFIGSSGPDGETDGLPSAGATGDDSSLNGDENGGVTFPPARLPNQGWVCGAYTTDPSQNHFCVSVAVTNNSGAAAQLVAWIDFNNDGDFNDPGERSLPDLASTATSGFASGNIPNGANGLSAVLVFALPAPIPNNASASVIRTRLTTDASFFSDASPPSHLGTVSNGEVQDDSIPVNTLPVTLAGFNAVRLDAGRIAVRWSVATEAGTLGYRLLQAAGGEAQTAAGGEFIPATGVDSVLPQYYQTTLLSSSEQPLYLEEIASGGKLERFGPFALGAVSGSELSFEPQPWAQAAAERSQQAQRDAQHNLLAQRGAGIAAAEALVEQTGLQRVAIADLAALGLQIIGAPANQLQVRRGDEQVPYRISGDGALNSGNHIEFYADAVEGSQYTRTRPYLITLGLGEGTRWSQSSAAPSGVLAATQLRREYRLDDNRYYNFSAPGADPWYYDTIQRNGAQGERSWTLQAPGLRDGPSQLRVELWGGLDFPDPGDDHRYRVSLNGQVLGERSFDGVHTDIGSWDLPAGLAVDGANAVRIELLDTGHPVDILRLESLVLSAVGLVDTDRAAQGLVPESIIGSPDGISLLSFEDEATQPPCGLGCVQLQVGDLPDADVVAVSVAGARAVELTDLQLQSDGGSWTATLRWDELLAQGDGGGAADRRLVIASRS